MVQILPQRRLIRLTSGVAVATALAAANCLGASADMELAVPVLSQQSGAWAAAPLGLSRSDSVGSSGCAVTSMAMLLGYYGIQTDPGALNAWLTQNNGYFADDVVIWSAITAYTGGQATWSEWLGPDPRLIRDELDAGRPVIAEVRLNGSQHFVVISGVNDQGLTINDPWFGDRVNFSDRYGDPSTGIVSIRTFYPAIAPQLRPPGQGSSSPASGAQPQRQAQ